MIRSIAPPPPCDCCGAEYRNTGCVRGYGCDCPGFATFCEVCKFCMTHCQCDEAMKAEFSVARADYLEALRLIRCAHPKQINKKLASI